MNKLYYEELLILEVSAHPLLFNKKHSDYSNRNKRNQIWQEIAQVLNSTVLECKSKWKNLKDTFFHYIRLDKNTPSGNSAGKKSKWVHMDTLQFLLPCLDSPSTISNYSLEGNVATQVEVPQKEPNSSKAKNRSDVGEVILEAIQHLDTREEPPSESKLFFDSLVPRFERLSKHSRSYIQFKMLELLHELEFDYTVSDASGD